MRVEAGYRVHLPNPADRGRPLCCGRTFLSAGLVGRARGELDRVVATYAPFALRGVPIVGLEPIRTGIVGGVLISAWTESALRSRRRAPRVQ